MTTYELMVILPGDMTEKEALTHLEIVKGYVKENGGTITETLVWGKRDLAYTIQKQDTGFYAVYHFIMEESVGMLELKNELRLDQKVMRELLIKIPDAYKFSEFEEACKEAQKEKEEAMAKRAKPKAHAKRNESDKREKSVGKEKQGVDASSGATGSEKKVAPAAKASVKKSSSDTVLDDPDLKL